MPQKALNEECHYVECCYTEYHYAECCYAECYYTECNYAECRGALFAQTLNLQYIEHIGLSKSKGSSKAYLHVQFQRPILQYASAFNSI